MQPLISVVIPCYNQGEFLCEALESVLLQSLNEWECIIVNDGSTDFTEDIAKNWVHRDERIKYIKKENGGLSSARNTGILIARGELILPLDADDKIGKKYLELASNAFAENPSISLVYCLAERFGVERGPWELEAYDYKKFLLNNSIFCSSVYKRADWEKLGGYNEDLKSGWEDWDFWCNLLTPDSVVLQIPEVLFYYRTKMDSMITRMEDRKQEEVRWIVFEKNIDKFKKVYPSPTYSYLEVEKLKQQLALTERQLKAYTNSTSFWLGNSIIRPFLFVKKYLKRIKL